MFYSRLKQDDYSITLDSIISICAGLNLTIQCTNEILASAGYTLKMTDKAHQAYSFVLSSMRGETMDTKNDFLKSLGVKPLV